MLAGGLIAGALAVAAADWVAVAGAHRRGEHVLKPLTLVLLIAGAAALGAGDPPPRVTLTLAALVLSLTGDVFLLLPRGFMAGLGSFLLAHVAYVAAFNTSPPPPVPTIAAGLVLVAAGAPVVLRLRSAAAPTWAVALYGVALGAMVASAVATTARPEWPGTRAALAVAGAVLFLASDGLNGWRRFVGAFRHDRVAVTATYHLAQVLLVLALLG